MKRTYFGKVGTSEQFVDMRDEPLAPQDFIPMLSEKPVGGEWLAQEDGKWSRVSYFDPDKRRLRNQYLQQTDWMIQRHQEQEQTQLQKTELTAADFNQILQWRQCLRDCLEAEPFSWPTLPPCLKNHLPDYPQKTD